MRFYEFNAFKPTKPLTPAQARTRSLKLQVDRSKAAVKSDRASQKRNNEHEQHRKHLQAQATQSRNQAEQHRKKSAAIAAQRPR